MSGIIRSFFIFLLYELLKAYDDEPCFNIEGLYSPINVFNSYFQDFRILMNAKNSNFNVNLLDVLQDNVTKQYKFLFEFEAVQQKAKSFVGIITQLRNPGKNPKQQVLKYIQSYEIDDVLMVLKHPKKNFGKIIDCPNFKKHFNMFSATQASVGVEKRENIQKLTKNSELQQIQKKKRLDYSKLNLDKFTNENREKI